VTGLESDGCGQRFAGAGNVLRPPPRGAQVILRIEQCRAELNRARESLQSGAGVSLLSTHEA
jgi:hypothetical protein